MLQRIALAISLVVVIAGCPSSSGPTRTPAAQVDAGERLADGLWLYPPTIAAYPAGERGAYVVDVDAGPDGDAVRARLAAGGDVVGDTGVVARLSADERARLAATAGVLAVRPLQPADRASPGLQHEVDIVDSVMIAVRIDGFADAMPAELDALAAWISAQGGRVTWRGPAALTASLPPVAIALASRLSAVRWVE